MSLFTSGESGRRVRSGPQGRLLAHRPTGGGSTTCCKSTHPSDTSFAPVDLLKSNAYQSCDINRFLSSVLVQKTLTTYMNRKANHQNNPKDEELYLWYTTTLKMIKNQKLFRVGMFYVELNPGEDADEEDVISQSIKEIHQVLTLNQNSKKM